LEKKIGSKLGKPKIEIEIQLQILKQGFRIKVCDRNLGRPRYHSFLFC